MIEPNPPITGQAAKLTTTRVSDADETTLVCVVHLNAKPVFAECCAVTRDGASRRVGTSPSGWRIDSVSAEAYDDGTVRMWLSSYPDGASGTEAAVRWIDFPDAVPPRAPALAGSVYATAPNGAIRALTKADFNGVLVLPLEQFGIPPCQWLSVKLTVSAPIANRRVYVGGTDNVFGMLTCASQTPDVRIYVSGIVAPSHDHTLIVKTETGMVNEVHLDIAGWCTL